MPLLKLSTADHPEDFTQAFTAFGPASMSYREATTRARDFSRNWPGVKVYVSERGHALGYAQHGSWHTTDTNHR